MGVVTAGEACKGAILEGNTILRGSILHLSSVYLLSAVVSLEWQGDRKSSELRRPLLLQQVAYLLALAGQQEHAECICNDLMFSWYILNLIVVSHKSQAETKDTGGHL